MLTFLGLASIALLLTLILFRVTSVIVALTVVPVVAALAGGFATEIGGFAMEGMRDVAPTAALLAFAVLYVGVMHDAGLFDPIIGRVVALVGHDPLSLAFDPDSFYFGVLPVLSTAAETAGGSGLEVARAALLGQMTTGFPVSPLTPATFLLVGLAQVDLADHQRRTIPYAFAVTLVMTAAALATGAIRW